MYIFRRMRYMFASGVTRTIFSITRMFFLFVLIIILMSGIISQRKLFENTVKLIRDYGYSAKDAVVTVVNGGNSVVEVTDEGVYFKNQGKGNKIETQIEDPAPEKDDLLEKIIDKGYEIENENPEEEQDTTNKNNPSEGENTNENKSE